MSLLQGQTSEKTLKKVNIYLKNKRLKIYEINKEIICKFALVFFFVRIFH